MYSAALADALRSADVYAPVREALGRGGDDLVNRQLYADLQVYLADDILVKVDRMSMATSLETRAPFLDVSVMEFAFSLPGRFKIRDGRAEVDRQAGPGGPGARADPHPAQGGLQHPDEAVAAP